MTDTQDTPGPARELASSSLPVDDGSSPPLRVNRTRKGIHAKATPSPQADLSDPTLYFNRELSHLQFNIRVLEQSLDPSHPLLNRLMFLLIFSSNLDEFFEIRVAGLKHQLALANEEVGADGLPPARTLEESMSIGWDILGLLGEGELTRLSNDQITRYVRRRKADA